MAELPNTPSGSETSGLPARYDLHQSPQGALDWVRVAREERDAPLQTKVNGEDVPPEQTRPVAHALSQWAPRRLGQRIASMLPEEYGPAYAQAAHGLRTTMKEINDTRLGRLRLGSPVSDFAGLPRQIYDRLDWAMKEGYHFVNSRHALLDTHDKDIYVDRLAHWQGMLLKRMKSDASVPLETVKEEIYHNAGKPDGRFPLVVCDRVWNDILQDVGKTDRFKDLCPLTTQEAARIRQAMRPLIALEPIKQAGLQADMAHYLEIEARAFRKSRLLVEDDVSPGSLAAAFTEAEKTIRAALQNPKHAVSLSQLKPLVAKAFGTASYDTERIMNNLEKLACQTWKTEEKGRVVRDMEHANDEKDGPDHTASPGVEQFEITDPDLLPEADAAVSGIAGVTPSREDVAAAARQTATPKAAAAKPRFAFAKVKTVSGAEIANNIAAGKGISFDLTLPVQREINSSKRGKLGTLRSQIDETRAKKLAKRKLTDFGPEIVKRISDKIEQAVASPNNVYFEMQERGIEGFVDRQERIDVRKNWWNDGIMLSGAKGKIAKGKLTLGELKTELERTKDGEPLFPQAVSEQLWKFVQSEIGGTKIAQDAVPANKVGNYHQRVKDAIWTESLRTNDAATQMISYFVEDGAPGTAAIDNRTALITEWYGADSQKLTQFKDSVVNLLEELKSAQGRMPRLLTPNLARTKQFIDKAFGAESDTSIKIYQDIEALAKKAWEVKTEQAANAR